MKQRLEPFLDLLDARYLPLLFAGAPQAWTVYAWLLSGGTPWGIALLGGIGFEFIYVGAVAWAERGAGWKAARGPAVTALAFSVAVAVAYYGANQGVLAALHAGFPLVAYFYVLMMHVRHGAPIATPYVASLQAELAQALKENIIWREECATQEQLIGAMLTEIDTPTVKEVAPRQLVDTPVDSEVDTRRQHVKSLVDSGVTVSSAARQAGVSRQTATKWLKG